MKPDELASILGVDASALPEVAGVTEDSRKVRPGWLFVAVSGSHTDGHDFAEQAAQDGAAAILGDRSGVQSFAGLPYIGVAHPRDSLGRIAHALAGNPTADMTVVGVTGTNGKTSTACMIHHILESCGHSAALFGTLGYSVNGRVHAASHTTPSSEKLASLFQESKEAGHDCVVLEVSSHALDQGRTAGIEFDVAVFTNLSQDHLDYHGDMGSYRESKLRLFRAIGTEKGFTVANADDPSFAYFRDASQGPCYTYGAAGECSAEALATKGSVTSFQIASPWGKAEVALPLLGTYNVSNALAAVTAARGLGVAVADAAEALGKLPPIPGRFEPVDEGQNFRVIVDYAHTDDGLRNLLGSARESCKGRLIVVFGCGGDRDKSKRPKMAEAVAETADFSVVTSDNPRTEDPEGIIKDIEGGMSRAGKSKPSDYVSIVDRAEAISYAIGLAKENDWVVIAGKGHEDYQILGTGRIHFDDREVARSKLGAP